MKNNIQKLIFFFSIVFLGMIWIYASLYKIAHPELFYENIVNYQIIKGTVAAWIALWFPFYELFMGILILTGIWRKEALFLSFITLIIFALVIAVTIGRGIHINCGCFAASGNNSLWKDFIRDIIFVIINFLALRFSMMK